MDEIFSYSNPATQRTIWICLVSASMPAVVVGDTCSFSTIFRGSYAVKVPILYIVASTGAPSLSPIFESAYVGEMAIFHVFVSLDASVLVPIDGA